MPYSAGPLMVVINCPARHVIWRRIYDQSYDTLRLCRVVIKLRLRYGLLTARCQHPVEQFLVFRRSNSNGVKSESFFCEVSKADQCITMRECSNRGLRIGFAGPRKAKGRAHIKFCLRLRNAHFGLPDRDHHVAVVRYQEGLPEKNKGHEEHGENQGNTQRFGTLNQGVHIASFRAAVTEA